jgi:hypothetical protein
MSTFASAVPVRRSWIQDLFTCLIVVYWLLVFLSPATVEATRGSAVYVLFVAPVMVFALIASASLVGRSRFSVRALLLACYAAIVCTVAVLRTDLPTITSTLLATLTLLAITVHRVSPPPTLLNALFLLSIPVGAVLRFADLSIYGVLPGMSLDEEVPWRVSLFPVVPESAFFSATILILNIVRRDLALRRVCIALALYFLLFSGLRSAVAGTMLALAYYFIVRPLSASRPVLKMAYLLAASLTFVAALVASQVLMLLAAVDSDLLNLYLFRSEGAAESEDALARTIYRNWIWSEHLRIAAQNPLLGVGTLDFAALAADEPVTGRVGSGSESFLTGLYARVGLPSLLFLAFILASIWNGVRRGRHEQLMMGQLLIVAMLAYGSFIVPYNFVCLVLFGYVCSTPYVVIEQRWNDSLPAGAVV